MKSHSVIVCFRAYPSPFFFHLQYSTYKASERTTNEELEETRIYGVEERNPQCLTGQSRHCDKKEMDTPANPAEVLFQRLLSAAKNASESSKDRPFRKSTAMSGRFVTDRKVPRTKTNTCTVPGISVDSDIDGLCVLAGPRSLSMPEMQTSKGEK